MIMQDNEKKPASGSRASLTLGNSVSWVKLQFFLKV